MTESDKIRKRLCALGRNLAIDTIRDNMSLDVALRVFREKMFHEGYDRVDILFVINRVKQSSDFSLARICRTERPFKVKLSSRRHRRQIRAMRQDQMTLLRARTPPVSLVD